MGDFGDFGNFCCFWKIYILARLELNNKKFYIYLSHFVEFGTWNFSILLEMVFCDICKLDQFLQELFES